MVAQCKAVARPLRYRIEQHRRRHARTLAQHHHFGNRHRVLEHQRVVDQLHHLPAAHAPAARDIGSHVAEHGFDARVKSLVGADHDAELTALCGLSGPRHRRIGERNALRRQLFGHRARDRNGGRAQIHDDRRRRRLSWRAPAGRGRLARPAELPGSDKNTMSACCATSARVVARRAFVPSSAANAAALRSKAMTSPPCLSATFRHMGAAHDPQADEADHGNSFLRHGTAPLQSIHMPPLISSDVPVIQLEAAEHRNSAACAISSALP